MPFSSGWGKVKHKTVKVFFLYFVFFWKMLRYAQQHITGELTILFHIVHWTNSSTQKRDLKWNCNPQTVPDWWFPVSPTVAAARHAKYLQHFLIFSISRFFSWTVKSHLIYVCDGKQSNTFMLYKVATSPLRKDEALHNW